MVTKVAAIAAQRMTGVSGKVACGKAACGKAACGIAPVAASKVATGRIVCVSIRMAEPPPGKCPFRHVDRRNGITIPVEAKWLTTR
jgi:hypothetical protein